MVQVHHRHSAIEVLVVQGCVIDVLRCTTGTFGYRSKVCAYAGDRRNLFALSGVLNIKKPLKGTKTVFLLTGISY